MVDISEVEEDTRVFGSKFVDDIKPVNIGVRYKCRLAARNYRDDQAATITTKAPTVQQLTQRFIQSMAASLKYTSTYTGNITSAYI